MDDFLQLEPVEASDSLDRGPITPSQSTAHAQWKLSWWKQIEGGIGKNGKQQSTYRVKYLYESDKGNGMVYKMDDDEPFSPWQVRCPYP